MSAGKELKFNNMLAALAINVGPINADSIFDVVM